MLESFGDRQRELLALLLNEKPGLTIDELSLRLGITRNAVRQHLAVLERDGLVGRGDRKPSGGRPEQLYCLSAKGAELFPRRYSWFAELLIDAMVTESGQTAVGAKLDAMGRAVGSRLGSAVAALPELSMRSERTAELMQELGYEARVASDSAGTTIEASNCVFHQLAARIPEVCRFDLGLIGEFANADVDHQECMVRGGNRCRFKLSARAIPPRAPNST